MLSRRKANWLIILVVLLSLLALVGCKGDDNGLANNEVISMIPYDTKRPTLVITTTDGMDWERLQKDLDAAFPDVNIVLRLAMNLESTALGDVADIYLAGQATLSPEVESHLLDLSAFSSTSNYYTTSLAACASINDGKQYMLPLPGNIRGIIYNKTMFEENGWKVPQGKSEFIKLCHTIEDSGVVDVAFQPSIYYAAEALLIGEFFQMANMFDTLDFFTWYENYAKKGIGSADYYLPTLLDTYKLLFKENILDSSVFTIQPQTRSKMLYIDRTAAMTVETQNAALYAANSRSTDEFAMMPFYSSDDPESGYVFVNPISYICVSSKVKEKGNEEKLKLVRRFLDYFATKQGQEIFIPEGNKAVSQIKNAEKDLGGSAMLENVQSTIDAGRLIPVRLLFNAGITLSRDAFFDILNSMYFTERRNQNIITEDRPVTYEEAVEYLDNINKEVLASSESKVETVYANAKKPFTVLQTSEYFAQMIKEYTQSDIALYMSNCICRGNNIAFPQGDLVKTVGGRSPLDELVIFDGSKRGVIIAEDDLKFAKVKMTGSQILEAIEYPIHGQESVLFEPFFVSAGLKIKFAPWAEVGSRYLKVTLADGSQLVPDKLYTVAIWNYTIKPEYITEYVKVYEDTFQDVLRAKLMKDKVIAPFTDKRFTLDWSVVKQDEIEEVKVE